MNNNKNMYSGLISPILIKTNLLMDTINNCNLYTPPPPPKINYKYLFLNIILPLFIIITLCLILRDRYKNKQELLKINKKKLLNTKHKIY